MRSREFLLLVAVFAVVSVSVSLRMPLGSFGALGNHTGPRYFFYSFVMMGWILIWMAAVARPLWQAVIGMAFIVTLVAAAPYIIRRSDAVDWRQNVLACAQASGPYDLPIHFAGSTGNMWKATVDASQCRALLEHSLF